MPDPVDADRDAYFRDRFLSELGYDRGAVVVPATIRFFSWTPWSHDRFRALLTGRCTCLQRDLPPDNDGPARWQCGDLVRVLRPAAEAPGEARNDDPVAFLMVVTDVVLDIATRPTQTASVRRLRLTTLSH